jgi:hypothetical protein
VAVKIQAVGDVILVWEGDKIVAVFEGEDAAQFAFDYAEMLRAAAATPGASSPPVSSPLSRQH